MADFCHPLQHSLMIGMKVVMLDALNGDGRICSRATGFVVAEKDGLHLYTCWHVVTGVDFIEVNPSKIPCRKSLTVRCQDVEERQPGVQAIGNTRLFRVPLYDNAGRPRWLQEKHERPHPDLNAIGIRVPQFYDVVRIPMEIDAPVREVVEFNAEDIFSGVLGAGQDVVIVGYPYGYSAMQDQTPEPIFLKRAIASTRTLGIGNDLLDGTGTPGMSGSPVIVFSRGRWWLYGIYTGIMFPDHFFGPEGRTNDRLAALGTFAKLNFARAIMDVPGLFEARQS